MNINSAYTNNYHDYDPLFLYYKNMKIKEVLINFHHELRLIL